MQRLYQRGFIDHGATGHIDEKRRWFHLSELRLAEQMPRVGRQGDVDTQEVGFAQDLVEGGAPAAERFHLRLRTARKIQKTHRKTRAAFRHRRADAAGPDDAEGLARHVDAAQERGRQAPPLAGAGKTVAFDDPARDAENQRPREIGNRVGENIGRVGNGNVATSGLREIDVVVADGDAGNNFEFWRRVEEFDIDAFTAPNDDAITGAHLRQEFIARQGSFFVMQKDLRAALAKQIHALSRYAARYQNLPNHAVILTTRDELVKL